MFHEENQLLAFVRRVMREEELREELKENPENVCMREQMTNVLEKVLISMMPKLITDESIAGYDRTGWWMPTVRKLDQDDLDLAC